MNLQQILGCPACGVLLPCGCPVGDHLFFESSDLWREFEQEGTMNGVALTEDQAQDYVLYRGDIARDS